LSEGSLPVIGETFMHEFMSSEEGQSVVCGNLIKCRYWLQQVIFRRFRCPHVHMNR
jgi:hypothetical protein